MPNGRFSESLAERADRVTLGLPGEYKPGIELNDGVVVLAAHGAIGSSLLTFRWTSRLLSTLLSSDTTPSDDELWQLWDQGRAES
jgi:hypothetical protein